MRRTKRNEQGTQCSGFYPDLEQLSALFVLERVSGFGPVKFRTMHDAGIDPQAALENPALLPFAGKVGEKLRQGITSLSVEDIATGRSRAAVQLDRARHHSASILVHGDSAYPQCVYASNNPMAVLYVRGNPAIWSGIGSVAVVGSRNTRDPYTEGVQNLVKAAIAKELVIVSGFATGADTIGHTTAITTGGKTICVMPCGLDNVFPPENRHLWKELLACPNAVFVSEFGFGQRASSLRLRKRNKLIVAFAKGVFVAQSAVDGGAMNAYRFGREQKKPVATFTSDGSKDTAGNVVIAQDERTGGVAFNPTCNEASYESCLNQLCSPL